jgi:hypothetical protein
MVPVKPLESFTMTTETTGTIKAMPHWAGESVSGVKTVKPVADIIKELVGGSRDAPPQMALRISFFLH